MKIAVLFNQLGPYHYARLNALGKQVRLYGIEFFSKSDLYEWDSTGLDIQSSFIKRTLFHVDDPSTISNLSLKRKIFETLEDVAPDAVAINGWSEAGAFAALKWCLLRKKPAIAMSESTEFDVERSFLKEFIKKKIVQKFSTALVGGIPHRHYMYKLGMRPDCIFEKYDVVDNNHFFSNAENAKKKTVEISERFQIPENFYLASARFIPKKNLINLIKAFSIYHLNANHNSWNLVLLGDGELRPILISLIDQLNLKDKVFLPGFKQYDELPYYYGLARAFIHASTSEQWGLVVNEAMASGLPVLISKQCGCVQDLLEEGGNGLNFNPYDIKDLAEKMLMLSSGDYDLQKMARRSNQIISNYTPEHFANNLKNAALKALTVKQKAFTLFDSLVLNYFILK